jgi:tripartite-type tricarboxylate transporter receptor subunit TctC
MLKKLFALLVTTAVGSVLSINSSFAAAPFFEGKSIRVIVGYSAGGGYDAYARALARHMSKHVAGNPTLIVENMTGAGSLVAANYVYKAAKPDGLTIGHFNGGLFFNQVMNQPGIEFDARKFEYIGAAVKEETAFAFSKSSGITSVEKWMASKTPVKMGGVAPGAFAPDNVIRIVKAALGFPVQLVSGYKGTADIRLAVENGELAGSSWGWASMKSTWRKALDSGEVVVVLQAVAKPFADLPQVPLAISLAKTEEARQLIDLGIHSPSIFARPFVLPPATPKDRLDILEKAFQETLKDKDFLAEAEKSKLDIEPVTRSELEKSVAGIFKLNAALVAKLNDILFK